MSYRSVLAFYAGCFLNMEIKVSSKMQNLEIAVRN